MNNTVKKETDRLKSEFKKANKELDKCSLKKCKHIKNIKKTFTKIIKCKKKFSNYPPEKILEKMTGINQCYEKSKIPPELMVKIGECIADKCNNKIKQIESLTSDLVYVSHPNGKEIKELKTKLDELTEQEKLCKAQKCGHIYPLDKLAAENAECNKLIFTKGDEHSKCVKKYNIYENNTAISKCKKSKCKKIIKEMDEIREKLFKLQNPNLLKQMAKNIMSKKKSKSRK